MEKYEISFQIIVILSQAPHGKEYIFVDFKSIQC